MPEFGNTGAGSVAGELRSGLAAPIGISLLAYSPWRIGGIGTFAVGLTRALIARRARQYVLFLPRMYEELWRDMLPSHTTMFVCGPHPDSRAQRVLFEQLR